MNNKQAIYDACIQVLERFMAGLNAHDADAMDACMHFPHIHFAGGAVTVYDVPGSNPMDLFQRLKAEDESFQPTRPQAAPFELLLDRQLGG